MKRPKALLYVSFTIVALLSLVACKAEVNIAVSEEDKGEIELIIAANDTILSLAQLGGENPFDYFLDVPEDELEAEGIESAGIEPYSEAGYSGIRIRVDFDPYDPAITALSTDDSMLGALTETLGIGNFSFTRTEQDDGWIVELDQSTDSSLTDDLEDIVGDIPGDIPFDTDTLNLPFILSLQLPGEYIEHNADREMNGILIWDLNLLEGINISAISRDSGTQFELVPIIITALFILIFGGIVVSVVISRERRRRRAEEDMKTEMNDNAQPTALSP